MKILFIAPPLPKANTNAQPLGFGYLASILRLEGFNDIKVLDACSLGLTVDDAIRFAREYGPDVVGITSMTVTIKNGLRIAAGIKADKIDTKIVLGGVHVSVLPEEAAADPNVDLVVRNEGEYAFLEAVQRWAAGEKAEDVAGTTVGVNGEIVHNPRRPRITDLDSLPFPARDLLPMHIYKAGLAFPPQIRLRTLMYSARGCPYDCKFCASSTVWGSHRWATRSATNVLDEIESVVDEFGIYGFEFVDELTTLDRDRLTKFCTGIHDRGLHKVRWVCSSTVRQVDYEMARMMREAGCSMLYLGVESGSPEIRRRLNKRISNEEIAHAFQATKKAGLRTGACFMLGAPGETAETVQETIGLARQIRPHKIALNIVTPYPGTAIYDEHVDRSIELDWDEAFSSDPDTPEEATIFYNVSGLPDEELQRLWTRFRREVELSPRNLLDLRMGINRLTNARNMRHLWRNFRGAFKMLLSR
jgi:anaerobic magnesium-protoporphyrin IX monomethyl ester cyclase